MKKTLSIILATILCLSLFAGCKTEMKNNANTTTAVYPLPETFGINSLDNCTVAVSLDKGGAYVDDSGKMVMRVSVYSYELYDMADVASLKENDTITRRNETIKITKIERLDTGLVRINGGEENGGFDLATNDSTVYFEMGMDDRKAYYKLGEVTLPVSDAFEYIDESEVDAEAKCYYPGDFLTEDAGIKYNFSPDNTSIVIENGTIVKMNKIYMP